jgi:hypothetical protein
MNRNVVAGLVVMLLLIPAVAWAWGWFDSESEPEVVAQLRSLDEQPPSEENDQSMRDAFRKQFEGVPEEKRMQVFEQLAPVIIPMMMARFETEYDKFMAMSPEEQRRELDRRINEMQNRGQRGMGGPGGGAGASGRGGGRPNVDPKQIQAFQKKMLAWTTPEQRAKFDNGIQMFRSRMEERGLTPPPMQGGGFF